MVRAINGDDDGAHSGDDDDDFVTATPDARKDLTQPQPAPAHNLDDFAGEPGGGSAQKQSRVQREKSKAVTSAASQMMRERETVEEGLPRRPMNVR